VNRLKQFNWSGWLFFGLLLLAWELGARSAPKLQVYFPPLSRVLAALAGPKRLILVPGAHHNESLRGDVWPEVERWVEDVLATRAEPMKQ